MPAVIREMSATDLIGRLVLNPNQVEFVIVDVILNARSGRFEVWVDELDLDEGGRFGAPVGLYSLEGWAVCHKLLDDLSVHPRQATRQ